jgi:hypothetical protein
MANDVALNVAEKAKDLLGCWPRRFAFLGVKWNLLDIFGTHSLMSSPALFENLIRPRCSRRNLSLISGGLRHFDLKKR